MSEVTLGQLMRDLRKRPVTSRLKQDDGQPFHDFEINPNAPDSLITTTGGSNDVAWILSKCRKLLNSRKEGWVNTGKGHCGHEWLTLDVRADTIIHGISLND